jgi:hypothetical protein
VNPTDADHRVIPWLDTQHFQNRQKFPPEELEKFAGRHIAWSWDGSRILASGETPENVEEQLAAAGIDPARVVFDFVIPPDVTLLGPFGSQE